MKIKIILLLLCLSVFLFAEQTLEDIQKKIFSDPEYETKRIQYAQEIDEIETKSLVEEFHQIYLKSYCYLDVNSSTMKKNNTLVKKAIELIKKMDDTEREKASWIMAGIEAKQKDLMNLNSFSFSDFRDSIEDYWENFELKATIVELCSNYKLILILKDNINSFHAKISENRYKDRYLILNDRLNKKQNEIPEMIEKNTMKE